MSWYFTKIGLRLFLLWLIISSGACVDAPDPVLRVGTNVWLGYEPLNLARSLGWLPPGKVKLVQYGSATQVMRSLSDGTIDSGALTLDEAILLQQQGTDIHIVLVTDFSSGADALLSRPGLEKLKDLKGHRVGVETTALGAYMMHRALEIGDLKLSDVLIVPIEFSQHEQAFREGKVDAVVTYEPVRSRLLSHGALSLLDSSRLPGEVVDVLVVRKEVLQQQKHNVSHLLDTWFKTVDYIASDPKQTAQRLATRLKMAPEAVMTAFNAIILIGYEQNKKLLLEQPIKLEEQASKLASVMWQNKLLSSQEKTASMFNADVLKELYP